MDNEEKIIDVEFQDIENEIYLTAPQVAQRIKDTDIRVRHWADADVFGDIIGIKKINGIKRYKESDVYKFAFIKDLLDNKNFKHDQVRIYLAKHGFKYAEFDSGLVDPKDPLGFQVLASALSVEVNKNLNQFLNELSEKNTEQLERYLLKFQEYLIKFHEMNLESKAETESAIESIVTEKLDDKLGKFENDFKVYLDEKEMRDRQHLVEIDDKMRNALEEARKQNEQEKKKGLIDRLLGR